MIVWKKIDGFDNYSVSTVGDVRNDKSGENLTAWRTKNGYWCVNPSQNGITQRFYVHRLVAQAFIPNPAEKEQVNHINGVKSDNRVENLEWCTSSENHRHRSRVLGVKSSGEHMSMMQDLARLTHYKPVLCVETKVVFGSVVDAAKSVDRSPCSIVDALKGRHETCAGFHWKYV